MHCDEQIAESRVELATERCRVCLKAKDGCDGELGAHCIVETRSRCLDELLANFEEAIRQLVRVPDCEAHRVAVPVVVRNCHVSQVVEFFRRVICMYVCCRAVDGAS